MFELAKNTKVLHRRKRPSPGDVAFFDNTYDRNNNGRRDDSLSHVAVVESVDEDGTIQMIHKSNRGVLPLIMNLHHPGEHKDTTGKVLNDFLRSNSDNGPVLSGELWRAFASFWALDDVAQTSRRAQYEPCRS
jgi:surface antigen